jgi:hypothetical protein
MWREAVLTSRILFRNLPGETEEYHENLRITDVPAEIRTEHLPNTSVERYL